jgi:uncharacterized protein
MAFGAQKIYPIDTKPSTAVGIGFPFDVPGVFRQTYYTKDAVRYNLLNFFLTDPPERYLNPNFGAGLRSFIFEQISNQNLDGLKETIGTQLREYFPNVSIGALNIYTIPDSNEITVQLKYSVLDTNINDQIELVFA